MKKLVLAMFLGASLFASNALWATETAEQAEVLAKSQSDIAEAAGKAWVGQLAQDMQLSADPLARAMAEIALQVLAATTSDDAKTSIGRLSADQKAALYSAKTSVPVRILLLQAACAGIYDQDALCGDPKLADALLADDGRNAFTVLIAESLRAHAALLALQAETKVNGKKSPNPEFRALAKAQETLASARVLKALSLSREYNDYAQAFKTPILIAIKRRPPPPEVLAGLPIEVSGLVAAFAPEELAAESVANAVITWTQMNYRHAGACAFPEAIELKAQCARIANLILANPKNSVVSAGFALRNLEDHAFSKRINAFDGIERQKVIDPTILLTLDWLALRTVLNKAATQGDVAAIPDALAWAELALAKIPNKPADVIAAESKARAEQEAKWQAESARMPSAEAVEVAAAAAQAVTEATAAAKMELEFDAVPPPAPPAKASSGCSPDADVKIDPTVVEFKN